MTVKLFSPKVDYIFKKIFGSESHPQVLISFLNACFKNEIIIQTVKLQNTEITKEFVENSFSRLDILATTNLGEVINIEMQRADEKNMIKRSLYYWSKIFTSSYSGKSAYQNLPRTVCINVLDFKLLDEENFHNTYLLYNKNKSRKLLTDTMELHFIELPKVSAAANGDDLSLWAAFINDPDSPEVLKAELRIPMIHEARSELSRISRDPAEAELYRQRQNAISDKYNALLSAEARGEAKGVRSTALMGLKEGLPISMIMKLTGLTEDEILSLK